MNHTEKRAAFEAWLELAANDGTDDPWLAESYEFDTNQLFADMCDDDGYLPRVAREQVRYILDYWIVDTGVGVLHGVSANTYGEAAQLVRLMKGRHLQPWKEAS